MTFFLTRLTITCQTSRRVVIFNRFFVYNVKKEYIFIQLKEKYIKWPGYFFQFIVMVGCSIVGCKSRSEQRIPGLTFHSFPAKPDVLSLWVAATGRSNWQPKATSKVCSIHFVDRAFITTKRRKYLKPGTIPEKQSHMKEIPIDSSTGSVQTIVKREADYVLQERKQPSKPCLMKEIPIDSSTCSVQTIVKREADYVLQERKQPRKGCLKLASTKPQSCPKKEKSDVERQLRVVQLKLERQKKISAIRLKKLRAVRESRRRLQKKVEVLENILVELKDKTFINTEESDTLFNILLLPSVSPVS